MKPGQVIKIDDQEEKMVKPPLAGNRPQYH